MLIVEDESLIRTLAVDAFREEKWEVVEAHTADAAITALKTQAAVHLLFTDIDLQCRETGWDIAEACRDRHRGVHVIYASGVQREHSRQVEGSLFFEKPYDCAAVVDASRTLLAKRRA